MPGNNLNGRPSRWEYGNPKVLPHVGAPNKEPADEFGLIKAEHDINVAAAAVFEAFAPLGASQQDKDVKAIGMALVAKQQTLGRARLVSQANLAGANEIKAKYKRASVAPVEEHNIGTFFQNVFYAPRGPSKPLAHDILAMLSIGAQYESTATKSFDPSVGQIITGPEDKMRVFDTGFAALRHHIAAKVFAEALEANEKGVSLHTIQFQEACDGGSVVMLHLRKVIQLTESIKTYRTNSQDEDIPTAVRLICKQVGVPVPLGYQDPATVPAAKLPAALPKPVPTDADPDASGPTKRGTLSLGTDDGTTDLANGLKAMMRKLKESGENMTESLLLTADENEDGELDVSEFEELYKDLHKELGMDEPGSQEVNDAWATIVREIPGSNSAHDRGYPADAIHAAVETLTLSISERRKKRRKMSNEMIARGSSSSSSGSGSETLDLGDRIKGGNVSIYSVSLDYFPDPTCGIFSTAFTIINTQYDNTVLYLSDRIKGDEPGSGSGGPYGWVGSDAAARMELDDIAADAAAGAAAAAGLAFGLWSQVGHGDLVWKLTAVHRAPRTDSKGRVVLASRRRREG